MIVHTTFDKSKVLHHLKHFLPSQSPLKDFVHHNLLHFFQHYPFHEANHLASKVFGYKTFPNIFEYRKWFHQGKIDEKIIYEIIVQYKGQENLEEFFFRMLYDNIDISFEGRLGRMMHIWKDYYKVNISKYVQPKLFRIISNYLDQGISIVEFPYKEGGLLDNIRYFEKQSYISSFLLKKGRARQWLLNNSEEIQLEHLLELLVGKEEWFEEYLFDISFEHPGWSGMVSVIEDHPEYLIKPRKISLEEFLILELLFQIDYLDYKLKSWQALSVVAPMPQQHLFEQPETDINFELLYLWQEAYEWTYYYKVLNAIKQNISSKSNTEPLKSAEFQTIHCIDDREESFRRYIELLAPQSKTYSTAGFFNIDAYYQPQHSYFKMKIAPAPTRPQHIIKEITNTVNYDEHTDIQLEARQESNISAWLMSQTIGFWSAFRLFKYLFNPNKNPVAISSEDHTHPEAFLQCEYTSTDGNLKYGFTLNEAADRAEILLKSIGLISDFAPLVYVISHGAGSTNNPYYAAYDCGACSGKPGSVNARVLCYFLNRMDIRKILLNRGINIPENTVFIPCLHNTTTDELLYYDTEKLNSSQKELFKKHQNVFKTALEFNAKERARRFANLNIKNLSTQNIHKKIKQRQYSIFEPRPEYNHATNALCIVGNRTLTRNLFLDRRAFLQSYDYQIDKDGKLLLGLMRALSPVCGGINLEYYYSRTDNQKLGSGSKLPHNVFGLLNVANGAEGDLRIGLPSQMVEIHDPVRLLMIIEQRPLIVQKIIESDPQILEWYKNTWIHLVCLDPESKKFFVYRHQKFLELTILKKQDLNKISLSELQSIFEKESEDLDVYQIIGIWN